MSKYFCHLALYDSQKYETKAISKFDLIWSPVKMEVGNLIVAPVELREATGIKGSRMYP